jgi:Flp pilus assembly protein TadG
VEFALVLPVIVLMIFGIVDVGRAVFQYNTLSQAARGASRVAIVNQTLASVRSAAKADSPSLNLQDSNIDVCFKTNTSTQKDCSSPGTEPCTTLVVGCLAIVDAHADYTPMTPVIGNILGTLSMSSTSIQPIEAICPSAARTTC